MSIRTSRGPTSRRSIVSGPRGAPARTAPYAGVLCACAPVFDRTGEDEVDGVAVMGTSLFSARDRDEVPGSYRKQLYRDWIYAVPWQWLRPALGTRSTNTRSWSARARIACSTTPPTS